MKFAAREIVKELKEKGVAELQRLVYDHLMRSLLTAIRTLDIGYHAQTDTNSHQQADIKSLKV